MPWGALDDQFHNHPKLSRIDPEAILPGHPELAHIALGAAAGLHSTAISWCSEYLTDGRVPRMQPAKLLGGDATAIVAELVRVRLWDIDPEGGYILHDYLDCNPSRAQVEAARAAKSEGGRRGGQASARKRQVGRSQDPLEGFSDVAEEAYPQGDAEASAQGYAQAEGQAESNSPTPTPTPTHSPSHTLNLSEGDAAVPAAASPASAAVVAPGGDARSSAQRLVAAYVRERRALGSAPTKGQRGALSVLVVEKLSGGMQESTGEEAIRRMVRKARSPKAFPAFVDEVEAEKRRSRPLAAVPPLHEPSAQEKEEAQVILRQAVEDSRRLASGVSRRAQA